MWPPKRGNLPLRVSGILKHLQENAANSHAGHNFDIHLCLASSLHFACYQTPFLRHNFEIPPPCALLDPPKYTSIDPAWLLTERPTPT